MSLSPVNSLSDAEDRPAIAGAHQPVPQPPEVDPGEVLPKRGRRRKRLSNADVVSLQRLLRRVVQARCACKIPTCRVAFRPHQRSEELVKFRMRLQEMPKMEVDQKASLLCHHCHNDAKPSFISMVRLLYRWKQQQVN